MSKEVEKESAKQKEIKPKTENKPKEVVSETSDSNLKEQKKVVQEKNEEAETKKLKEEVATLKKDKLLLLAEIENKRRDFRQQIDNVYKYGSKALVSQVLNFLVELEEKALAAMRNDLKNSRESEPRPKSPEKEALLKQIQQLKTENKPTELVEKLKEIIKQLEVENEQLKKEKELFANKFEGHLIGMEIIKNNLKRRLEDEGVKEIEIKIGEDRANVRYHELIDEVKNDNLPEGTIVEIVEKGYFLHEEVVRRAKVKIAKKSKKN